MPKGKYPIWCAISLSSQRIIGDWGGGFIFEVVLTTRYYILRLTQPRVFHFRIATLYSRLLFIVFLALPVAFPLKCDTLYAEK